MEYEGRAGARSQLQLALDEVTFEEAEVLLAKVLHLVDIVEVGTPFLLRDGVGAVRRLRAAFPGVKLLADMKIMDGGRLEAAMGFEAGAKLVTVLAAAEDATIRRVVRVAEEMGGEVMVDLIGVKDLPGRASEVDALGVHFVCVHTPVDVQQEEGRGVADGLASLRGVASRLRRSSLALAGGIGPLNVARIAPLRPGVVVVGRAISAAADPRVAAARVREVLDEARRVP